MSLASAESRNSKKKASWLPLSWGAQFAIAIAGSAIVWWWRIAWTDGAYSPAPGNVGLAAAELMLCSTLSLFLPLWALLLLTKQLGRYGRWGTALSSLLLLSFTLWIMNALITGWVQTGRGGVVRWLVLLSPIAFILLYPLPIMRMRRKADALAARGDYEGALRTSRKWLRSQTYGPAFQGRIMLQAGRYSDALELLHGSAFDKKGKPLLTSVNLYFYAVTLMCQKKYAEAQALLEAAAAVPQRYEDQFRFTLAECLLSQHKDAHHALEFVDGVLTKLRKNTRSNEGRGFIAHCIAVKAWALASCDRRDEATASLDEAFAGSDALDKDDLGGLLNLKGNVLLALGDREEARAAFLQTLAVFPFGNVAMTAQRGLEDLCNSEHM
jgi:tetratricopeptide (TPR) repeat protein